MNNKIDWSQIPDDFEDSSRPIDLAELENILGCPLIEDLPVISAYLDRLEAQEIAEQRAAARAKQQEEARKRAVEQARKQRRKERRRKKRAVNRSRGLCVECSQPKLEAHNSLCEVHWFKAQRLYWYEYSKGYPKVTWEDFKQKFEDQKNCFLCGELLVAGKASADHGIPISRQGSYHLDNLYYLCDTEINRMKADMTMQEFIKHCIDLAKTSDGNTQRDARSKKIASYWLAKETESHTDPSHLNQEIETLLSSHQQAQQQVIELESKIVQFASILSDANKLREIIAEKEHLEQEKHKRKNKHIFDKIQQLRSATLCSAPPPVVDASTKLKSKLSKLKNQLTMPVSKPIPDILDPTLVDIVLKSDSFLINTI